MIIKNIQLSNFRCFKSLTLDFHPKLTVLIAENGNGKTAVLDSIAIAMDEVVKFFVRASSRSASRAILQRNDVRLGKDFASVAITVEVSNESVLEWTDSVSIEGPDKINHSSGKRPDELINHLERQWRGETLGDAPLVVFYKANRAFRQQIDSSKFRLTSFDPRKAFEMALDAASDLEAVQHWFFQVETEEAREKAKLKDFNYEDKRLKGVRHAVREMIPNVESLGFEPGDTKLSIFWNPLFADDDAISHFPGLLSLQQLSDGYRTLLAMVMDLATRLVLANPDRDDPLDAQAIVLVDEIDLHLHPRLQQKVVSDLTRIFSNIQWVFTSHSPQVLSTVRPESIRILSNGEAITPEGAHTFGVQSHRVLNDIMGVSARPEIQVMEEMKKRVMDQIQESPGETGGLPEMRELVEILGSDDPFIVNAKAEIIRLTRKPS